jgi:hypothetical protein
MATVCLWPGPCELGEQTTAAVDTLAPLHSFCAKEERVLSVLEGHPGYSGHALNFPCEDSEPRFDSSWAHNQH